MKVLALLTLVVAVVGVKPAMAADVYTKAAAAYAAGTMPDPTHMFANSAWVGKCVRMGEPMVRTPGAIYFHSDNDPVLGTFFNMVPLFGCKADDHVDAYKKLAVAEIESVRVIWTVYVDKKENAWGSAYKRGHRYEKGLLREVKQVDGTVGFMMRLEPLEINPPKVVTYYPDGYTPPPPPPTPYTYCYYYASEVGEGGGEPLVTPPPTATSRLPEEK